MADKLIKELGLNLYPQSGCAKLYFVETYRSSLTVKPLSDERNGRSAFTTIYLLAKKGEFGSWHRLKSDETFFYHRGNTLRIAVINADGKLNVVNVGDRLTDENAVYHYTVPANCVFNFGLAEKGSEEYGLFTVAVSPGFDLADTEITDPVKLAEEFPQHKQTIEQFTN